MSIHVDFFSILCYSENNIKGQEGKTDESNRNRKEI